MHSAKSQKATSPKFHVCDKVRITRKKGTFEKEFTPNWTQEVFIISSVKATRTPTYTSSIECTGNFQYRTRNQEEEKTSVCQVESLP